METGISGTICYNRIGAKVQSRLALFRASLPDSYSGLHIALLRDLPVFLLPCISWWIFPRIPSALRPWCSGFHSFYYRCDAQTNRKKIERSRKKHLVFGQVIFVINPRLACPTRSFKKADLSHLKNGINDKAIDSRSIMLICKLGKC
jgi:hypothetical protein